MKPPLYTRLMAAAEVLFLENGFHATGIDYILAEAGVAKSSLYTHFASKDELITAVLRLKSRKVLAWLQAEVERRSSRKDGADKITALFGAYGDWLEMEDFHGCLFTKAALEFPDPAHPAHKAAASHTRKLLAFLQKITPGPRPASAEQVLLLLNGALMVATLTGAGRAPADRAGEAARRLCQIQAGDS